MSEFKGGIIVEDPTFEPVAPELNVQATAEGMVIDDPEKVEKPDLDDLSIVPDNQTNTDTDKLDSLSAIFKGLNIPTQLNIIDDEGNEKLYNVDDLTTEAQLDYIKQQLQAVNAGMDLSKDEQDFINTIRNSTGDVNSFIELLKQQAIEDANSGYAALEQVQQLTPEQVYLNNLLNEYPNISDEDAYAILTEELKNPILFERKVELLRTQLVEQTKAEIAAQNKDKGSDMTTEEFANTLREIGANGIVTDTVEFDSESLQDTIEFLTKTDAVGRRYIEEVLKDPKELMTMVHLYLNKDQIIQDTIQQTAEYIKNNTNQKATQEQPRQKHNLVIKQPTKKTTPIKGSQGIPYQAFAENPAFKNK